MILPLSSELGILKRLQQKAMARVFKELEHFFCGERQRDGTVQPGDKKAQRGSHQYI